MPHFTTELEFMSYILDEPHFCVFQICEYRCVINRHPITKTLCGYVDITNLKNENIIDKISCHGGITWDGKIEWLCEHLPHERIIGFDCNHHCDQSIFDVNGFGVNGIFKYQHGYGNYTYKDFKYVYNELESIVQQLKRG